MVRLLGALLASLIVTGGCSSSHSASGGYIAVKSGRYLGVPWRLFASNVNGQFCMELRRVDAQAQHPFAGACVFANQPSKGSYYFASGPGPHGSHVNYGPLPANAVAVQIATHQTVGTYGLPSGQGLPHGRFWIDFEPASWPAPAEGKALDVPQPLDRDGKRVAFRRFYTAASRDRALTRRTRAVSRR